MKLAFGMICHGAMADSNGNLHIMGMFEAIFAPKFPVRIGYATILLRLEMTSVEASSPHTVRVVLVNQDAKPIFELKLDGTFKHNGTRRGFANIIAPVPGQIFVVPKPGDHEFQVLCDGQTIGTIPINFEQVPK